METTIRLFQIDDKFITRDDYVIEMLNKIHNRLVEIEKRLPPIPPKAD